MPCCARLACAPASTASPHLHTFRERIRIDGQLIAQADVVRLLAQCQPAIEAVPGITTFEIMTVLALLHFAQQGVDWVVLEVGLGGRLDATNVVVPAVSVITPISLEHTALLGDTLDLIAREKAGIIKPGVPVVVAPQHVEALAAIEEVAARQGSRLVLAGRDWTWQSVADTVAGQTFAVRGGQPVGLRPADGPAYPAAGRASTGQCHDRHRRLRASWPGRARLSTPTACVAAWPRSSGRAGWRCCQRLRRACRRWCWTRPTTTFQPACCAAPWRTISPADPCTSSLASPTTKMRPAS